jgi:hypothetical protein
MKQLGGNMNISRNESNCKGAKKSYQPSAFTHQLTEVRHDHSLAVVARKSSVEYAVFTEPRAPASGSLTNFG